MKWLLGGVTDIQAITYKLLPESPVEDHILAVGHLANDVVFASTQNCASGIPWSERLEIHGSLGSLVVEQLANPPALYIHTSEPTDSMQPFPEPAEALAWNY